MALWTFFRVLCDFCTYRGPESTNHDEAAALAVRDGFHWVLVRNPVEKEPNKRWWCGHCPLPDRWKGHFKTPPSQET